MTSLAQPPNPLEEDDRLPQQTTNEEFAHSSKPEETDPSIVQANDGEVGYSVEVQAADGPDEQPSNVVRFRRRSKVLAGNSDPQTVAS